MTALANHCTPALRLNWPRIGAWSGSLSLHLYVIALLFTPAAALQLLKRTQPEQVVELVQKRPEPVQPEPILPQPVRHETRVRPTPHVATVDHPPGPPVIKGPPDPTGPEKAGPAKPGPEPLADVEPTALGYGLRTRVAYPIEAARRREQGTVILRVLVGADGIPQIVEIEASSGSPRLDNAARDAVKRWNFRPGTRNGLAQSAWARVPVAFNLSQL